MFCPGCGRFLNNNAKECVECGLKIDNQYKIEKNARLAEGIDPDWKKITLPKDPQTTNIKAVLKTVELSKVLSITGIMCSIIMVVTFLMPWISWTDTSTGETIKYSGLSILNGTWIGTMGIIKYYPFIIALIGVECILLFLMRCRGCTDILTTIMGILSVVLCLVFSVAIVISTDCNYSFGLLMCFIASAAVMMIGLHGVKISRNPF